jgi:hypothetical protein
VHDLDTVAFWDGELLRAILETGTGPNWDRLPPELRTKQTHLRPTDLPEGRDIIWARVDLGIGSFTDPVHRAVEQAEAVVALTGFHAEAVRWRRLDGYLDFVDDRLHSMSTFGAPDRLDEIVAPTYTDYMTAELCAGSVKFSM